jgi:hypothetical protein
MSTLAAWQRIATEAGHDPQIDALLAQAAECSDAPTTAQVGQLRRLGDAQLVHAALQLAKARRKASGKFAESEQLLADPEGVEMSSSTLIAAYKARRMAERLAVTKPASDASDEVDVLDVCSGVGGDAIEMLRAGLRVCALDSDPTRAALCEGNLRRTANHIAKWSDDPAGHAANMPAFEVRCMQAESLAASETTPARAVRARAVHIDPSRRTATTRLQASTRTTTWDELLPAPETIASLLEHYPNAGLKQRAGLDFAQLPSWLPPCEAEVISEHGKLTQCMLWFGDLRSEEARTQQSQQPSSINTFASIHRRATLLVPIAQDPREVCVYSLSEQGEERSPITAPLANFLYEPDDSIERVGLLAQLCDLAHAEDSSAGMPHPRAGLLTSSQLLQGAAAPWLRGFRVLSSETFQPKTLTKLVQQHDPGHVEVKTRGKVVNPDEWQPKLSRKGQGQPLTVFVVRFGERVQAIVTQRLERHTPKHATRNASAGD